MPAQVALLLLDLLRVTTIDMQLPMACMNALRLLRLPFVFRIVKVRFLIVQMDGMLMRTRCKIALYHFFTGAHSCHMVLHAWQAN